MKTTDKLIIENMFFAEMLAAKIKKKIKNFSYEELKSAAYLGLVESANKYDSLKNSSFRAFAYSRINGAIKDYLREMSWGSRRNPFNILYLQKEEV